MKLKEEFIGQLDESGAGLNRVLSVLEDQSKDFLFITASRGDKTSKENRKGNNQLIKALRKKLGKEIGAYKIIGHWKECSVPLEDGETIKDCKGAVKNALEETWLIVKTDDITSETFDNVAQEIAKKYYQDAYVIRTKGKLTLNGKDGTVWGDLGKASKSSLSTGFEKIANIVFEDIYLTIPKDNISSKKLFSSANILY